MAASVLLSLRLPSASAADFGHHLRGDIDSAHIFSTDDGRLQLVVRCCINRYGTGICKLYCSNYIDIVLVGEICGNICTIVVTNRVATLGARSDKYTKLTRSDKLAQ